jgi:hypothetical protein
MVRRIVLCDLLRRSAVVRATNHPDNRKSPDLALLPAVRSGVFGPGIGLRHHRQDDERLFPDD